MNKDEINILIIILLITVSFTKLSTVYSNLTFHKIQKLIINKFQYNSIK